jgi:hypothetical protein
MFQTHTVTATVITTFTSTLIATATTTLKPIVKFIAKI